MNGSSINGRSILMRSIGIKHFGGAKRRRILAISSALDAEHNCPYIWRMCYEWDPAKVAANLAKHGVSFAEAATVLEDDFALTRGES